MDGAVRIERLIDLPRPIVWDALVDPVLVEGWLHPVLRLVGGEPAVELLERVDPVPGVGALLRVRGEELGEVVLTADQRAGGTRGASTAMLVRVATPHPRFDPAIRETWQARLDRLEDLLRGHPADWRVVAAGAAVVPSAAPARGSRAN